MKPHHFIAVESLLTQANGALDLIGRIPLGTIKEEELKTYFGLKRAIELVSRVVEEASVALDEERLLDAKNRRKS